MKRFGYLFFVFSILAVMMAGCSTAQNSEEKDLQRLSEIDIYSQDGDLITSITDEVTLGQFSEVVENQDLQITESEQSEFAASEETLPVLYQIIFYKTPAARFNNGELEEELRLTVYENSNIVKEVISPENVKNISVSEEYLTFYFTMSDEDRELLISLVERTEG